MDLIKRPNTCLQCKRDFFMNEILYQPANIFITIPTRDHLLEEYSFPF